MPATMRQLLLAVAAARRLLVVLVVLETQEAVAAQLVAAIMLAAHSTNKLEGEGVKALALVKMFFDSTQDYAQDKTQRKTLNTFTP